VGEETILFVHHLNASFASPDSIRDQPANLPRERDGRVKPGHDDDARGEGIKPPPPCGEGLGVGCNLRKEPHPVFASLRRPSPGRGNISLVTLFAEMTMRIISCYPQLLILSSGRSLGHDLGEIILA
jgi:hypothetical protein